MRARLAKLLVALGEIFWLMPALIVVGCVALALALVAVDRAGILPDSLIASRFIYSGDAQGARTLLGAVASSTISVAGTVFSITIAALTLAAGQMGPRLLRNFTRDRGNQAVLGIFLGTYSYALMVIRTVRGEGHDPFTPHLSLTVGILLAFISVGMLIFFVGHIASRINVDTVIDLVTDDVDRAITRLTLPTPEPHAAQPPPLCGGEAVRDRRRGFLQHLDEQGLADWAAERGTIVQLLMRPGDYVFPGTVIARVDPPVEGAAEAIRDATALGRSRISSQDLEFAVRQLVEVAVRALSPGINDPHTAMSVLVRFGAVLCNLSRRHLPGGVITRDGRLVLMHPCVTYDGLADAMLHMIRQNSAGSVAVLATGLDVLTAAVGVERASDRLTTLRRHADLWLSAAKRDVSDRSDLADVERRHDRFVAAAQDALAVTGETNTG